MRKREEFAAAAAVSGKFEFHLDDKWAVGKTPPTVPCPAPIPPAAANNPTSNSVANNKPVYFLFPTLLTDYRHASEMFGTVADSDMLTAT